MNGTVSNLIASKQYGFITGDDTQEYFFHKEDMSTDWYDMIERFDTQGGGKVKVLFEPTKTKKGKRAILVTVI